LSIDSVVGAGVIIDGAMLVEVMEILVEKIDVELVVDVGNISEKDVVPVAVAVVGKNPDADADATLEAKESVAKADPFEKEPGRLVERGAKDESESIVEAADAPDVGKPDATEEEGISAVAGNDATALETAVGDENAGKVDAALPKAVDEGPSTVTVVVAKTTDTIVTVAPPWPAVEIIAVGRASASASVDVPLVAAARLEVAVDEVIV